MKRCWCLVINCRVMCLIVNWYCRGPCVSEFTPVQKNHFPLCEKWCVKLFLIKSFKLCSLRNTKVFHTANKRQEEGAVNKNSLLLFDVKMRHREAKTQFKLWLWTQPCMPTCLLQHSTQIHFIRTVSGLLRVDPHPDQWCQNSCFASEVRSQIFAMTSLLWGRADFEIRHQQCACVGQREASAALFL